MSCLLRPLPKQVLLTVCVIWHQLVQNPRKLPTIKEPSGDKLRPALGQILFSKQWKNKAGFPGALAPTFFGPEVCFLKHSLGPGLSN